jgi:transposase
METPRTKIFRSREERRQIVEETLKPGASVSLVARAHDVNANQVFSWRKQYREGRFGEPSPEPAALLPVQISKTPDKRIDSVPKIKKSTARNCRGTIQIEWNSIRIRIDGAADPDCVRVVLDGLVR